MECGYTNTTKNEISQSQNSSTNNSIRFARFGSSIASICINYKYAFFVLSCVLFLCCAAREKCPDCSAAHCGHCHSATECTAEIKSMHHDQRRILLFSVHAHLRSFCFVHCSPRTQIAAPFDFIAACKKKKT